MGNSEVLNIVHLLSIYPFLFFSLQKLNDQDEKFHTTVKKAGDTMNKKQFGPLDIALTKRRARVHTESIKKRKRKRTRRSIAGKIV